MQQLTPQGQLGRAGPLSPPQRVRKASPRPFPAAVKGQAETKVTVNARRVLAATARLWLAETDKN